MTDSAELDIVFAAARPLRVEDRDGFLQGVAERLAAMPERGDGVVFQICREVQREHWIIAFRTIHMLKGFDDFLEKGLPAWERHYRETFDRCRGRNGEPQSGQ